MAFYNYDSVEKLDDSKDEWTVRVRAQSVWKGITKKTGEFRGLNIIFFDDYVRLIQHTPFVNIYYCTFL